MLFSTISCVGVYRSTESDNTPVVFAHQSKWQQDMMRLYGEYICLIDATYKTNIYDMPLFFLCVLTNCGYVNVATFLLSDEQKDSIAAGLRQIVQWNGDWQPQCFLTDFSEAQIGALECVLHVTEYVIVDGHTCE